MLILPNQAGVALGLIAFAVGSMVSIVSGVTLEIAILRGGIAFLIFSVFGWLMAYLIHEEEKPETEEKKPEKEEVKAPVESPEATKEPVAALKAEASTTGDLDAHGLETPDDSDF